MDSFQIWGWIYLLPVYFGGYWSTISLYPGLLYIWLISTMVMFLNHKIKISRNITITRICLQFVYWKSADTLTNQNITKFETVTVFHGYYVEVLVWKVFLSVPKNNIHLLFNARFELLHFPVILVIYQTHTFIFTIPKVQNYQKVKYVAYYK